MQYDINKTIEGIVSLYDMGKNPNDIIKMAFQKDPSMNQISTQFQNMAQGKNMQEFVLQLAKQNGVNEKNLKAISRIFGKK